MNYKTKYLKYKLKYLNAKNIYGGMVDGDLDEDEEKLVLCFNKISLETPESQKTQETPEKMKMEIETPEKMKMEIETPEKMGEKRNYEHIASTPPGKHNPYNLDRDSRQILLRISPEKTVEECIQEKK